MQRNRQRAIREVWARNFQNETWPGHFLDVHLLEALYGRVKEIFVLQYFVSILATTHAHTHTHTKMSSAQPGEEFILFNSTLRFAGPGALVAIDTEFPGGFQRPASGFNVLQFIRKLNSFAVHGSRCNFKKNLPVCIIRQSHTLSQFG